ncbi:MAG: von Willebrand factor type A domain-containing protein [Niabella sp.]
MKQVYLLFTLLSVIILLAFTMAKGWVTGTVKDDAGNPIPYVSVTVKGTQSFTSSNKDGTYKINAKEGDVLIFSSIGYPTKEITVGKQTVINVQMSQTNQTLDEVVVVGFGTTMKKELTGSSVMIRGTASNQPGYNYTPAPMQESRIDDSWRYNNNYNREGYEHLGENPFLRVTDNPLSTFSIDVDQASYSNIRRYINNGQLPPDGSVRIEEMINYFSYNYPQPTGNAPFSINTEYAHCPWNTQHHLMLIGLQGKKIPTENLPPANLVFLIDVSGSMSGNNKLPLVQESMKLLTDQLRPQDKVSIVVYAGNAGLVLPPTSGSEKATVKSAIDRLRAGGSTAGGAGIQLAYKVALDNFVKKGNNRVILCTDGDFNVGLSSDAALEKLIEEKRESGVFLTVLGYGMGNYQDAKMQKLADKGNGNHAYIDTKKEAEKVLVSQFGGTMFTIAKDVKLQIEFNPAKVQGYRLIGYENRMLAKEDFNNDKKDAGELGSGHTVTAVYEIIPVGIPAEELKNVDALKYNQPSNNTVAKNSDEVMTVKFRYKHPENSKSLLIDRVVEGNPKSFSSVSDNFRLAAAVAQFGMILRNSEYKGNGGYEFVKNTLSNMVKNDEEGYKIELLQLVHAASKMSGNINNQEQHNEELSFWHK